MTSEHLTDRIAGTLVGLACGDALGAGYEFTWPGPDEDIVMKGGGIGPFAPGEWTDDTCMALCVAEVTATGRWDVEAIGQRFLDWAASGPKDIGVSTRAVLTSAGSPADLRAAAAAYFVRHPRGAAGNGSLMRTAPVALSHLGDDAALAAAATEASLLTHGDPFAAQACVIWCVAIDRAVREGRLDGVRDGAGLLAADHRRSWTEALDEAEAQPAGAFAPNGYVVTALQAAHAAVHQTPVSTDDPPRHLRDALVAATYVGRLRRIQGRRMAWKSGWANAARFSTNQFPSSVRYDCGGVEWMVRVGSVPRSLPVDMMPVSRAASTSAATFVR